MNYKIVISFVTLTIYSTLTFAGGNASGGGDTQCETDIKAIQEDIAKWLLSPTDGPRNLNLHGLKFEDYINGMTAFVNTEPECTPDLVTIEPECTPELVAIKPNCTQELATIEGTQKTCKWETNSPKSGLPRITCNTGRFNSTESNKRYELIHHEIAGLAHLEIPVGSNSRYDVVSDQISEFLDFVVVKKLKIKKTSPLACFPAELMSVENGGQGNLQLFYKKFWLKDFNSQNSAVQATSMINEATTDDKYFCLQILGDYVSSPSIVDRKALKQAQKQAHNANSNENKVCYPVPSITIREQNRGAIIQLYYKDFWLKDFDGKTAAALGIHLIMKEHVRKYKFCFENSTEKVISSWLEE